MLRVFEKVFFLKRGISFEKRDLFEKGFFFEKGDFF